MFHKQATFSNSPPIFYWLDLRCTDTVLHHMKMFQKTYNSENVLEIGYLL